MLAWACKETGGGMNTTLIKTGNKISGSAYSWAFLSGMNVSGAHMWSTPTVTR
jgi:hypothetical protein